VFSSRPFLEVLRVATARSSRLSLGAVAVTCVARTAAAAPEQEPIRLEYVADAGCPSSEDFQRMVFQRTHSARPAVDAETARLFTVALRRDQAMVRGSLTVSEGEQTLVRQVNGHDCVELASVLALATALAIDPSAELLPPGTTGDELPDDTTPTGPTATQPVTPPPPAAPAPSSEPLPNDPPDALPSDPSTKKVLLALGPRTDWAATPYPAVGPSIAIELGTAEQTWSVGLAASLLLTPSKDVASARADFRIVTASLNLCSLTFRWQSWVQAGPCLQADFGDIYATSSDIPFSESSHRFWSTLGAHLKVLTRLSDDWSLALDIGPHLVLTQYRFEFNEPDTKVFQQGSWSGSARLMLGRTL
jgi:hypothetical protein